ncbi:hypothetical protein FK498_00805 [Elioraea sp. Yellowstone]|jgi:hypothetical protein|uniref:hypothetical protein n=1 Tax=Elioraea TaxID=457933 RepID=UPI001152C7E5|nr:hypothetical protein [Elioraea sp. Yellowstone]TQF85257.1 hypothetical protein FK498_00805 [Elioraea sp. Yellowstone]GIX11575.1 MAG: hypothetical protein KatS3mg116_3285 [Elioraea sp.]
MAPPGRHRRALQINESAEHTRAKLRLAKWLTSFAAEASEPAPFRVVVEYPFTEGGGGVTAWDACGFSRKPTLPTLRKRWGALICICDMVLIAGGKVTTAVEVVKTNVTPHWKVTWLRSHGVEVYEATAEAILACKGRPGSFDVLMVPA